MHARHGVQAAILSTVGDRWISFHDIVKTLQPDGWRLGLIEHQLRYLVREGTLWVRRDVRRKRYLEPKYIRARQPVDDPLIGTAKPSARCSVCPRALSDPSETFQSHEVA